MAISFAEILKDNMATLEATTRKTLEEFVPYFHMDWYTRFGDNDRVWGRELSEDWKRQKGHGDKLVYLFELQESVTYDKHPSHIRNGNTVKIWQTVYTSNWKFPIHEYGFAMLNIPARQTLTPSEIEEGSGFTLNLYHAFIKAMPGLVP